MKKRTFVNVGVMTASNTFIRFLGICYKLWLARMISPTALGINQLAMSLYLVLLAPVSSGMPSSVSRLCAKHADKKNDILASAERISLIASFLISLFTFVFCVPMAKLFLHDKNAFAVCIALIPSVFFGSLACVKSGFLHSQGKSFISALITVSEQTVKVLFGFIIIGLFAGKSTYFDASLPLLAMGAGALVSFVLYSCFVSSKSKSTLYTKEVISCALSPTLSRLAGTLIHLLTTSLLPVMLVRFGLTHDAALAEYGILTSMAYPVVYMPITVTGAMSTVLLPKVSAMENKKQIRKKVTVYSLGALAVSATFCIVLLLFAPFIADTLYSHPEAGRYMILLVPSVLSLAPAQMFSCALLGMGKLKLTFFLSLSDGLLGLVLMIIFAGNFGIIGFIAANCIQDALALAINSAAFFICCRREKCK